MKVTEVRQNIVKVNEEVLAQGFLVVTGVNMFLYLLLLNYVDKIDSINFVKQVLDVLRNFDIDFENEDNQNIVVHSRLSESSIFPLKDILVLDLDLSIHL